MRKLYWLVFILFLTEEVYPQWVQSNGPYGGSVNSFVVSGTNLFAGTGGSFRGGGTVFLSTNNGTSWTAVGSGLPTRSEEVGVLGFSADGAYLFARIQWVGVFRSADNGSSWTEVNSGLPDNKWVTSFAVKGNNLFVSLYYGGVFISTDNGTSWVSAGLGDKHVTALAATADDANLFAGTDSDEDNVFRSTDNGTSWTAVDSGLTNVTLVEAFATVPDGSGGISLFAGTWDGLFVSTNYGTSWAKVSSGLPTDISVSCFAVDGTNLYLGAANAGNYGKGGVFLSTNNGTSWTSVGLENKWVSALAITSNPAGGTNLFAGDYDGTGIFLSTDNGTTWSEVNKGLTNIEISSFTVFPTEGGIPCLFAGTSWKGIFLSTNNGTDWTEINSGIPKDGEYTAVTSFAISDTNIFAGTSSGVIRSTNDGNSWTEVNSGLPPDPYIMALSVSGTNLFAGVLAFPTGLRYTSVYLSTNNGTNWTEVNSGLPTNVGSYTFAVIGTNIFVGTKWTLNDGGVFLSNNNGSSWAKVNSGLPPNVSVNSIIVSGTNIFAGTWGSGIYRSTDNGTSWTKADTGLPPSADVESLAASGTNIFTAILSSTGPIGTFGVYLSTNNGESWSPVNSGLPNVGVSSLAINDTYLFAGTDGCSVWRRPLSEMITAVESSSELPKNFILEQNYPNPFNPATTISFSLPRKSFVSLKVFDALGRDVAILLADELSAGTYARQWNAAGLASGVYFYRLQAGLFSETRKLILLR